MRVQSVSEKSDTCTRVFDISENKRVHAFVSTNLPFLMPAITNPENPHLES